MEERARQLSEVDRLYLQRAYELAARAIGNTSPNPPVGAVVVRDGRIVGEGYHHRAGDAHAETWALEEAGSSAHGATAYVSLEPCNHVGRTPPCARNLADAGVRRVVVGTIDPNPKTNGSGITFLRERGIEVDVSGDARAGALIEAFAGSLTLDRPYVALKMAMSLDGAVSSKPGVRERISSEAEQRYVRELRIAYDAVLVGAGTVRVDDPQLTVRPPHRRLRPFVRIVACETDAVARTSLVFAPVDGYAKTIVLAPAGLQARFEDLADVADLTLVGGARDERLDLGEALRTLRRRGIYSVLCEGGPTAAGNLIAAGLVDRFYWAISPLFLHGARAVPVVGAELAGLGRKARFDRIERIGEDVMLS
ncbi:MAG: bifunctional diaminohydroxyphosphoribosylaminopyrimidine deaminase/5-amino-6-(5-phosphoribosylamino)uracil reductase RibD, partial [Candidatus Eremiobacteraeota bacterium]|nr:bifunctional diaminohydroxyphosphoribosylaminopyrimidine deaminase/5-amino-6-(5-phosphoribosylamino)uracil reductase RibD [Candidatus Eremiobacteraeota bacterium]